MSGFISVGDQSRLAYLRQANAQLKTRLTVLTQEATTGLKSDVPAAMQGAMGPLAQVESRLVTLGAYQQNAALAANEFSGLQDAMAGIGSIAGTLAPGLQNAATLGDETAMNLRSREAADDFDAVMRFLNTDVGGRYILSGTAVQTAPFDGAETIIADAKAAAAGAATTSDLIDAVSAWFDAPDGTAGFGQAHYRGGTLSTSIGVSATATVQNEFDAKNPAFVQILKGLALAALANDGDLALGPTDKALMLREAGRNLAKGSYDLTMMRASVGLKQEQIEQAATRNAAERTALSITRSDMLTADPYETASAITQNEANLQNLYALTARLSRLSLTEYLR